MSVNVEAGGTVRWLTTRDGLIVTVSLLLLTYEITLGGARPVVLTCLSGLLLSPIVMRIDAARNRRNDDEDSP